LFAFLLLLLSFKSNIGKYFGWYCNWCCWCCCCCCSIDFVYGNNYLLTLPSSTTSGWFFSVSVSAWRKQRLHYSMDGWNRCLKVIWFSFSNVTSEKLFLIRSLLFRSTHRCGRSIVTSWIQVGMHDGTVNWARSHVIEWENLMTGKLMGWQAKICSFAWCFALILWYIYFSWCSCVLVLIFVSFAFFFILI